MCATNVTMLVTCYTCCEHYIGSFAVKAAVMMLALGILASTQLLPSGTDVASFDCNMSSGLT